MGSLIGDCSRELTLSGRNNMVHQFWLYAHRGDNRVIRKKLEKVAQVASDLIELFNDLGEEVGVDEYYDLML